MARDSIYSIGSVDTGVEVKGVKNRCVAAEWVQDVNIMEDSRIRDAGKEFHMYHPFYAEAHRLKIGFNSDAPISITHWGRAFEYPWALMHGEIQPMNLTLDAAGGFGVLQYALARCCRAVVNLDHDPTSLSAVRAVCRNNGVGLNILPVLGDLTSLPFPDDTFDRVFCISAIEDLGKKWRTGINELMRVVVPKGVVILTMDVNLPGSENDFAIQFEQALEYTGEFAQTLSKHVPLAMRYHDEPPFSCLCMKFVK